MTQFSLTVDQLSIQEMAQKFTADAITPLAAEWDEKHIFPRDTIKQAAELGFGWIYVSEESGGIGLGRLERAIIMEAMAYGCPSISPFISIHNMASWMIDTFGAQAVKDKYLPDLVPMDKISSYCLTEAGAGSDAASLKTKAVRDVDDYIVNGSKQFISGGGEKEIYVTMTRTSDDGAKGVTCLVIEKDMEGESFGVNEKKLGWHSQPTAQVNFDNVRVPAENRVGDEGEGFRIAMAGLDGGRLNIGACSLGGAQRCLDVAVNYTKERKQFGKAISDFQNTSSCSPIWQPISKLRGRCFILQRPRSPKGLRTKPNLPRWPSVWRDLRVNSILEGANQVMRMNVSRELLRQ